MYFFATHAGKTHTIHIHKSFREIFAFGGLVGGGVYILFRMVVPRLVFQDNTTHGVDSCHERANLGGREQWGKTLEQDFGVPKGPASILGVSTVEEQSRTHISPPDVIWKRSRASKNPT